MLAHMPRIAILDDYSNVALSSADWASLPSECAVTEFDRHLGGEDDVARALAHFDVIVAMRERTPFPASLLARLPELRLLVTTGMRNLAIDMDAARARGVTVCGTAMTSYAAFEHTWALILAAAKNLPREDRCMREGGWQQAGIGFGLHGKTLGVLGLGKLGAQVARVGLAFGMDVCAWSENLTAARCAEVGVRHVARDALFEQADVLTIHLVLSARTRGLVGARELARMKRSAWLVNTSRGPIVDEPALIAALREGTIAGAALDVFDVEPLPADHPLRALPGTILTGHTGYAIREAYALAYGEALEDVRAWLAGAPIRVLNP